MRKTLNLIGRLNIIGLATVCVMVGLPTVRLSAAEPASSADGFVDAIGVNTHLKVNYAGISVYTNPQIAVLLGQSGIRHLRDDMPLNYVHVGGAKFQSLFYRIIKFPAQ